MVKCLRQVQAIGISTWDHISNREFSGVAWAYLVDNGSDVVNSQLNTWPRGRKQDNDRELFADAILLVTKILVRGNQKSVATLFRSFKQHAIVQVGQSSLEGRIGRMPREMSAEGHRRALIE